MSLLDQQFRHQNPFESPECRMFTRLLLRLSWLPVWELLGPSKYSATPRGLLAPLRLQPLFGMRSQREETLLLLSQGIVIAVGLLIS